MKDVALVHMDLMAKGGGEAVAVNVVEALQNDYDVTLVTLTEPDVAELNAYFDVDVDESALDVRTAGRLAPAVYRQFGLRYYVLENAMLGRYARRHADEFDLLISTINELGLGPDSIQYIHFPFDWHLSMGELDDVFHPTVGGDSVYEWLCTAVADVRSDELQSNRLFTNSEWTADKVEEADGTRPDVLYPPVDTREFTDHPWDERENGFVTVGRIERSKRIAELVEVIDGVRRRGHDVHLHVIGPTVDEEYYRTVAGMAEERPYVELEGEVPRSELVERICTHRYGIHGKEYEHFGMAVAELAAGGTIPFVPSTGGQHAIVRDQDRLLFDSPDHAVDQIDAVLADPDAQEELRTSTAEIERRFGRDRFQTAIADAVADAVGRQRSVATRTVASESNPAATDD